MHIHHFTLRHVVRLLEKKLKGAIVGEIFTQEKDELVIAMGNPDEDVYLRVACGQPLPFVWPISQFNKARKNVLSLCREIYGMEIKGVSTLDWERVILLSFEKDYSLVLKMYGNQSNVLLRKGQEVLYSFRKGLGPDMDYMPEAGTFEKDWHERLQNRGEQPLINALREISPLLDKQFAEKVKYGVTEGMSEVEALQKALDDAEEDRFFLRKRTDRIQFMLFDTGYEGALEIKGIKPALDIFFRSWYQYRSYARHYEMIRKPLRKHLKKCRGQIRSYEESIRKIETERNPEEIGNIIMANLHVMEQGQDKVELYDFYQDQQLKISLKPDLNPQQNAERYYTKVKKRKSTLSHTRVQLDKLYQDLEALEALETGFNEFPEPKALYLGERGLQGARAKELARFYKQHLDLLETGKPDKEVRKHPFMEFRRNGFVIWVGKNARQNDELSFQASHKDDVWLHARDVPGSHVVIRHQAGKQVPQEVLEYAAGLAAHFSKRKHDTLAPVIYVPRKQVRKPKGAAPGEVVVDREAVIMVEPVSLQNPEFQ